MKKRYEWFLIVSITFLLSGNYTFGQGLRTIKGMVTTFDSIPLINATIVVKSSKLEHYSDSLGHFELDCLPNDKITVKAEGFASRTIKLNPQNKLVLINLDLKKSPNSVETAIGYGHVADRDKLAAISSLRNKDDDFSKYSSMYELIRGKFAGVQISGNDIIIRGQNSFDLSTAALIVIDGAILDSSALNSLSPINVKSIDIIKDGSSAIYGSRGANGVVIITTKTGRD